MTSEISSYGLIDAMPHIDDDKTTVALAEAERKRLKHQQKIAITTPQLTQTDMHDIRDARPNTNVPLKNK